MIRNARVGKGAAAISIFASMALALSACSGGAGAAGSASTGEGVPFGATQEEYKAAFENVEPVTLKIQTGGAQGAPQNVGREAYMKAIEEWSGGKIKFDIYFSNGLVAKATEVDNALADGRLDFSFTVLPSYEPDIYPVNNAVADASFVGGQGFLGHLNSSAWLTDVSYTNPEFSQELAEEGVKMLLPTLPGMGNQTNPIVCGEDSPTSLATAKGRTVAVSGTAKTRQAEALGMSPVSLPWNEQYEGLQRGVISCAITSIGAVDAGGLYPVAPNATIDSEVSLSYVPAIVAMSQDSWDELPLVGQQLLFDKMEILLADSIENGILGMQKGMAGFEKNGGKVTGFDQGARSALQAANDALLESVAAKKLPGVSVDEIEEKSQAWHKVFVDELGFEDHDLVDGARNYTAGSFDAATYVDRLYKDVLLARRPA